MKELKPIDYKILWELVKNSRRSDRTLAKVLKSSQPTITRRRARLEKDVLIGYTAVPEWEKIGFEIIAFTFVKTKTRFAKTEERKAAIQKAKEWMMKQPNVVFASEGQGMGWTGVFVSLHKSYSEFAKFMRKHDSELSDYLTESQSFTADLGSEVILKSFHFKYLAETK
jgi:DNA-binding Lrp family transcriptional regulator